MDKIPTVMLSDAPTPSWPLSPSRWLCWGFWSEGQGSPCSLKERRLDKNIKLTKMPHPYPPKWCRPSLLRTHSDP